MAAPSVVIDGLSTPPEGRVGPAFGDLLARASRLGGPTPPAERRTDETAHPGDELADVVIKDLVADESLYSAHPGDEDLVADVVIKDLVADESLYSAHPGDEDLVADVVIKDLVADEGLYSAHPGDELADVVIKDLVADEGLYSAHPGDEDLVADVVIKDLVADEGLYSAHPGDELADVVIEDLVAAGEVLSAAAPGMGRPLHLQDGRGFSEVLAEALTVLLPAAAETERVCGSADAFVPGRAQRNGAGLATRLVPGTLTAAAAARLACSWPRAGSVAVSDADVDMSRALRRRLARAGAISGCTFDGDALTVAENSPLLGSDRARRPEELAMSRTAESAADDDNKGADQCLISISM